MSTISRYSSISGHKNFINTCSLGNGKVAFLIVVKAGLEKLADYSSLAAYNALIESGDIKYIIPCRGNMAAGSTNTKQASGLKSTQKTGTAFSHPIIIDNNQRNMDIINDINDDCNQYGVIFVFKDYNAAHILDNDAIQQRYLPVTFDITTQSDGSDQSTLEGSGNVSWTAKHTEFYASVPSALLNRPDIPTNLDTASVLTTSFSLSWDAVEEATAYELDVSTDLDFSTFETGYNAKEIATNPTTVTTSITGLTTGTTYYVRVRAKNGAGTSPNSVVLAQTTS